MTAAHDVNVPASWTTWCEVSAPALANNCRELRRRVGPDVLLGVVVKSDAYGHGAVAASEVLLAAGADWLIVNALNEAERLRAAGQQAPIYVCGPVLPAQAERVVAADVRIVVYERSLVDAVAQAACGSGRQVGVHLKVETGNHRQGLAIEAGLALAQHIADTEGVWLEGVTTHYADIEDTTDHRFAMGQLSAFSQACARLQDAGFSAPLAHSANSAATILWPKTHGGLVRPGIATYGLWPSSETHAVAVALSGQGGDHEGRGGFLPDLQPALSWRARIAQVKSVPVGAYIGYGRTFRATHPMRVAVLPMGYYEGYDRRLSNLGHVLIDGQRAPVRGRVCMNMTMVDVTHIGGVAVGDVATLLGNDGDEAVSAETLAGWMGSINYEVVSRIHPVVPRLLV
ncbi:MAG: alanine racemase [Myxococcota bacterium]|jgi:alanine racemase